jgi:hypothetical protein
MSRTKILLGIGAVVAVGFAGLTAWSAQAKPRRTAPKLTVKKSYSAKAWSKWGAPKPAPRVNEQVRLASKLQYRGTQVKPHPEAREEEFGIQREIAEAINWFDQKPAQRLEHFRWCDKPGLACTGWYGVIEELTPIRGGLSVKVRVSPYLVTSESAVTMTPDYFIETYHYINGKLTYIEGSPPDKDMSGSIRTF